MPPASSDGTPRRNPARRSRATVGIVLGARGPPKPATPRGRREGLAPRPGPPGPPRERPTPARAARSVTSGSAGRLAAEPSGDVSRPRWLPSRRLVDDSAFGVMLRDNPSMALPELWAASAREESVRVLADLGLPTPAMLPLLDDFTLRPTEEILRRMGVLSALAAVAYGCPAATALKWVRSSDLVKDLLPAELAYFARGTHEPSDPEASLPEALFGLAWALQLSGAPLDFQTAAPDDLIHVVPHPPPGARDWRSLVSSSRPRPAAEVGRMLDLYYCLHWTAVEAGLRGRPLGSGPKWSAVVERRRALEWLVSADAWDEVALDT